MQRISPCDSTELTGNSPVAVSMLPLVEIVGRVHDDAHGALTRLEVEQVVAPVESEQPRLSLADPERDQVVAVAAERGSAVRRFGPELTCDHVGLPSVTKSKTYSLTFTFTFTFRWQ